MRPVGLIGLLALAAAAPAAEGAAWLKIPQGARSVALGTAVSALRGGAEGQWYTPAALGHVSAPELSVSRQAWIGQTRDDYLGAVMPVGRRGALGAYANVLGTDDIYRDALGQEGPKFSNSAWAAGLGYGARLRWLSVGVAAKAVQERFADSQASGYAADAGLQAELGRPWLRVGAAMLNLGSLSGYRSSLGSVELPLTYRIGLAVDQPVPGLLLSVEARQAPLSQESSVLAGIELSRDLGSWSAALRGGYETAAARAGELAGLAVGAGLRMHSLKVDFTYTPYGAFGDPYRMTLGYEFSGSRREDRDKPVDTRAVENAPLPELGPPGAVPAAGPTGAKSGAFDAALGALAAKEWDLAEALFQAALEQEPVRAREGLFRVYYNSGRKEKAVAALKAKLALQPDAAQAEWLGRYERRP